MAPILSFTAEEAWQVMTRGESMTVFEELWHPFPANDLDPAVIGHWGNLRQLRDLAMKKIEERRAEKELGSSLEAELDIRAHGEIFDSLARLGEELRFAFITSRATVTEADGAPISVVVTPSKYRKCDRCWHYRADVNAEGLCGRCQSNLHGAGETRRYA